MRIFSTKFTAPTSPTCGIAIDWHNDKHLIDEPLKLLKILSANYLHVVEELKKIADKDIKILEDEKTARMEIENTLKLIEQMKEQMKEQQKYMLHWSSIQKQQELINKMQYIPYKKYEPIQEFEEKQELSRRQNSGGCMIFILAVVTATLLNFI